MKQSNFGSPAAGSHALAVGDRRWLNNWDETSCLCLVVEMDEVCVNVVDSLGRKVSVNRGHVGTTLCAKLNQSHSPALDQAFATYLRLGKPALAKGDWTHRAVGLEWVKIVDAMRAHLSAPIEARYAQKLTALTELVSTHEQELKRLTEELEQYPERKLRLRVEAVLRPGETVATKTWVVGGDLSKELVAELVDVLATRLCKSTLEIQRGYRSQEHKYFFGWEIRNGYLEFKGDADALLNALEATKVSLQDITA